MEKRGVEYVETCPECNSKDLARDYERAEIICNECGLVIDEQIMDSGPEWRAFDSEQTTKKSRVGAPMTYMLHDKGLSTVIDWRNKDYSGRELSPKRKAQVYRLRKWQQRIRVSNSTERNLAYALTELDRVASRINLPRNVKEIAAVVYRKAVEKKLIRGRSIEGVTAASIYAACRQCKVPRTLDEIADTAKLNRREIGRTYRYISRELGLSLSPTTPIDYVPRFGSELNLTGEIQSKAIEILKKAMERGLTSGRGPTSIAAAAIYIASVLHGERRTQREVADVAGITEVTIRNRYKELAESLDIEITM